MSSFKNPRKRLAITIVTHGNIKQIILLAWLCVIQIILGRYIFSFNLTNTFYDLFHHIQSPDSHLKLLTLFRLYSQWLNWFVLFILFRLKNLKSNRNGPLACSANYEKTSLRNVARILSCQLPAKNQPCVFYQIQIKKEK